MSKPRVRKPKAATSPAPVKASDFTDALRDLLTKPAPCPTCGRCPTCGHAMPPAPAPVSVPAIPWWVEPPRTSPLFPPDIYIGDPPGGCRIATTHDGISINLC